MAEHIHIYRSTGKAVTDRFGRQGALLVCDCGVEFVDWGEEDDENPPAKPKDPKTPGDPAQPS